MKILHEVKAIDRYLSGKLKTASRLLFEARLLVDPQLRIRVEYQEKLYAIVKESGRRALKSEIARIHYQLFNDPGKRHFQSQIFELFNKK
ncbi:MAG TPA: hypothetical protein VFZ52_09300 [Chryseolinea sp.]